jgi:hypothetical protein
MGISTWQPGVSFESWRGGGCAAWSYAPLGFGRTLDRKQMGRRPLRDRNAVQETARRADSERPVLGDGLVHLTKDGASHGYCAGTERPRRGAVSRRERSKNGLCYAARVRFPMGFAPPVFCAECGCEVVPAAWLCATCGSSLHVPGAMISTRPYSVGPPQKSQPAHNLSGRIFGTAGTVGFWVLYVALRRNRLPTVHGKHLEGPLMGLWVVLLLIIFWADGIFDRRR